MKHFFLSLLILIVTLSVHAQKTYGVKISLGAELGAVTGDISDLYSFAAGATGQLDFSVDNSLTITGNAGLIQLIGKKINSSVKNTSLTLVPLLGGIKYYFTKNIYGSGQLGSSVRLRKDGGSIFTYIPGIGIKFDNRVDALIKYTGYKDLGGTFGVRIGYTL